MTTTTTSTTTSTTDPTKRALKLTRIAVGILAVALLGSAAGNVTLLRSSKTYYTQENEVRLDPAGLRDYAKERESAPPGADRPVLAFFGDSRALMWGTPAESLPGYELRNVGVGNQTTAQLLLRFDADVPRLHPSIIVFEGGVNDLKAIAVLPARRAAIVDECKKNLTRLVEKSRATGATVVLTSIFAVGDVPMFRRMFWSDDVATAVVEVNAHLKSLAGEKVVWLDADAVLDDERGKVKPELQYDFLHLNAAGYAVLNEKLAPLVKR